MSKKKTKKNIEGSTYRFSIKGTSAENQYLLETPGACILFYYNDEVIEFLGNINLQASFFNLDVEDAMNIFLTSKPIPGYYLLNHITRRIKTVLTHLHQPDKTTLWNDVCMILNGKYLSVDDSVIVQETPPSSIEVMEKMEEKMLLQLFGF